MKDLSILEITLKPDGKEVSYDGDCSYNHINEDVE